jgi:hypothetical protein
MAKANRLEKGVVDIIMAIQCYGSPEVISVDSSHSLAVLNNGVGVRESMATAVSKNTDCCTSRLANSRDQTHNS